MSERDSDFRIKPGRIRSTRAPRTKSYVNQVLAAAQRAGHMPSGALAGKAGRRLGHSTFGRGRNVFGRSRIFSPQRRVVVRRPRPGTPNAHITPSAGVRGTARR